VNNKIYAIGGSTQSGRYASLTAPILNGGFVGTNEEYDPETNMWAFKESMPTPRARFAIATYENKIYCIGGISGYSTSGGYEFTGANEVYDPATNTWTTKIPIPTPRDMLQANVVDGKIYLTGGYPNKTLNEVYDPATNTWTTQTTPVPIGVSGYASAVVNNTIYIIGGVSPQNQETNLNQIYNPKTDKWSQGELAPASGSTWVATATTGMNAPKQIYVFDEAATYVYNPALNNWTTCTSKPTALTYFSVVTVNDVIYTIGGHTFTYIDFIGSFAPSPVNEQYMPIGYGTPDPTYETPSPLPSSSPAPSQSQTQTPSPTPTPSQMPPSTPTPTSPTLTITPSPTSSATQQPSPSNSSPTPGNNSGLQVNIYWVGTAVGAAAIIIITTALVLRKQRKHT
jgi:N-acetylneuraminic acid mutarotase